MRSNHVRTLLGLLAMVPSNPNGNGENSTGMMGIATDAPQDTAASSGKFYDLLA